MQEPMKLSLSGDEALVLFDLLSRNEDKDIISVQGEAEASVLANLLVQLESQLVEPLQVDYRELVDSARKRVEAS